MNVGDILDLIAGPLAKRFPNLKRNERSIIAMEGPNRISIRAKVRKPKTVAVKAKAKTTKKKAA